MPAIGSEQLASNLTAILRLPQPHWRPAPSTTASRPTTVASIILSNFLPSDTAADAHHAHSAPPTVAPPSVENLVVASSGEDLSNFRDVTFDFFDEDDNLFGSPLAFDASEDGLWNGRFVPPPPRPPFFVDDGPVPMSDGLTTCDLCSWAMPTKSTFIFEGTIEKASELGWPLTLIIVSILSALLGAIIMITVVRCRRKKSSNNRNETHVQWWSRNKRPTGGGGSNNNNHLRRSNIYTAHPADSIRGLHQPATSLSTSSSLTAMTAMVAGAAAAATTPGPSAAAAAAGAATAGPSHQQQQQQYYQQQQQHMHHQFHPRALAQQQQQQHQSHQHHHHQQQQQQHEYEYEHEYHQPQELQLQLQHGHQRQHSSSMSSSATSSPSLTTTITTMMPVPMQLHQQQQHHYHQQQQQQQQLQQHEPCNWANGSTMAVAS